MRLDIPAQLLTGYCGFSHDLVALSGKKPAGEELLMLVRYPGR
jgi:hypothetical protein